MAKITVETDLEYAHRLQFHEGKCKNLHGHSARLVLTCHSRPDLVKRNGMIVDFGDVKGVLKGLADRLLDHATCVAFNDVKLRRFLRLAGSKTYTMNRGHEPTAECLCMELVRCLRAPMEELGVGAYSLDFYEGPKTCVSFSSAEVLASK